MGCGGSKEILEECEKPLCSKMDRVELEDLDGIFSKCSEIINQIEQKRQILVDDLIDNYYNTGAWAYKKPDPDKALECCIWKLGVDNKGKISEIGFNSECSLFEGNCNSENGNKAANDLINYMKNIENLFRQEEKDKLKDELTEIVEQVSSNMNNYIKEIGEKCESNPMKGFKLCSNLKCNLAKASLALNCSKDLWGKMNDLLASAPKVMKKCTHENFELQKEYVEKACKSNETENLPIAWFVIPSNSRRGNTCKAADEEYCTKLKARKLLFSKINK